MPNTLCKSFFNKDMSLLICYKGFKKDNDKYGYLCDQDMKDNTTVGYCEVFLVVYSLRQQVRTSASVTE